MRTSSNMYTRSSVGRFMMGECSQVEVASIVQRAARLARLPQVIQYVQELSYKL